MEIDKDMQALIDDIKNGKLDEYFKNIDNSDFGFYIPSFEDQGTIKLMMDGYSQKEQNLVVSIEQKYGNAPTGGLTVGWISKPFDPSKNPYFKDSVCNSHSGGNSCTHCTTHDGPTIQCSNCDKGLESLPGIDLAPELDYHEVIKQVKDKEELINSLAPYGVGLSLLHGHSNQFMFTTLPEGYVSVIVDGVTTFRKESDVAQDETFVPNAWRSINSELRVAGGHSQLVIN